MRFIAHRGLHLEHPAGPVPENTLAAFEAAIAEPSLGGLELDLRLLGDGTPVVFHDEDTARILGESHRLQGLDASSWAALRTTDGFSLPSLADAIPCFQEALRRPDFELHLELKVSPDHRPLLAAVLPYLQQLADLTRYQGAGRLVVSSFDPRFLIALAAQLRPGPRLELALIAHRRAALDALALLPRTGLAIHVDVQLLDAHPELLAKWAEAAYPVRVWTVDTAAVALQLAALSEPFRPRAVMSDRPLALIAALSSPLA